MPLEERVRAGRGVECGRLMGMIVLWSAGEIAGGWRASFWVLR